MTPITVADVCRGVMESLRARFPDLPVHGESMPEGFQMPCFYVKLLEAGHEKGVGRRYNRRHRFDVQYFDSTHTALHARAEELYDCLEHITVSGASVRGKGMAHEVQDTVLHFYVQYDLHLMRERPAAPLMEALEQEGYVK